MATSSHNFKVLIDKKVPSELECGDGTFLTSTTPREKYRRKYRLIDLLPSI
jgi:hypothetical protein